MIVDDSTVKGFLRLDEDEDISIYIDAAEQYFCDAVGRTPDPDSSREIMAVCAITQEFYDHRTMIADDPAKDRLRHVISSLLDHVRLDMMEDDDGNDG